MRIAFYSPAWPASRALNGIATYVDILTRALVRAGHHCVILTPQILGAHDERPVIKIERARQGLLADYVARLRKRIGGPKAFDSKTPALAIAQAVEKAERLGAIDLVEIEESFGRGLHLQRHLRHAGCASITWPAFSCAPRDDGAA